MWYVSCVYLIFGFERYMKRYVDVQLLFQTLLRLKEDIFGIFQKRKNVMQFFWKQLYKQTFNVTNTAQYCTQPLCILLPILLYYFPFQFTPFHALFKSFFITLRNQYHNGSITPVKCRVGIRKPSRLIKVDWNLLHHPPPTLRLHSLAPFLWPNFFKPLKQNKMLWWKTNKCWLFAIILFLSESIKFIERHFTVLLKRTALTHLVSLPFSNKQEKTWTFFEIFPLLNQQCESLLQY